MWIPRGRGVSEHVPTCFEYTGKWLGSSSRATRTACEGGTLTGFRRTGDSENLGSKRCAVFLLVRGTSGCAACGKDLQGADDTASATTRLCVLVALALSLAPMLLTLFSEHAVIRRMPSWATRLRGYGSWVGCRPGAPATSCVSGGMAAPPELAGHARACGSYSSPWLPRTL